MDQVVGFLGIDCQIEKLITSWVVEIANKFETMRAVTPHFGDRIVDHAVFGIELLIPSCDGFAFQ